MDEKRKQVWTDGGTGGENCTLEECVIEAVRRGWTSRADKVAIVSLGCGYTDKSMSFKKACGKNSLESVTVFVNRARAQSIPEQIREYKVGWKKVLPMLRLGRVDFELPEEQNVLDGIEFIPQYIRIGERLAEDHVPSLVRLLK